jgi:hypothetical protein
VIPPAGGAFSTTGNITGGNILTGGLVSATGTVTGSSHLGATVSVTGNITGGNILGGANVNATTHTGTTVSVSGNVTGGNIVTAGLISATGNVSGNFFLGNGSQLSGISAAASAAKIENGTSNVQFTGSGGSATVNIGGTANVIVIDTTTIYANVANVQSIVKSSANAIGNIGSTTNYFNQIFVDRVNATTVSAAGNITGGNLVTSGTAGILSVNSITHTGTNAIGNIGSSSSYFNQVFATATTALYADVAERFWADEILEAGTVVELGGRAEITRSLTELSENVFGVISTRAAYLMNGGAGENDTHPPVAMTGRVPVKVVGIVHKGDRLVSAGAGIARAAQAGEATSFNVIGRSLVDKPTTESGTIEAIVTIKN